MNAGPGPEKTSVIYFAGGCFWGLEKYMALVPGVADTDVGYANGRTENPSYEQVCRDNTGHAETVKVVYDPAAVTLPYLLSLFFDVIDPLSLNRQGNDRGTQYRTGIYYTDAADGQTAREFIAERQKNYSAPIAVEVLPLKNYYPAEEYHQDYLDKNPSGYCHIGPDKFASAARASDPAAGQEPAEKQTAPAVGPGRYVRPSDGELRSRLSPVQYNVAVEAGTERPFANEYWDSDEKGLYVDIATGEPLFLSSDKFASGCGWPSFTKPVDEAVVTEKTDTSHGMVRTEVRSHAGDIHLGHVFDDGPEEAGGLRYCINSASLRFVPKDKMAEEGYAEFVPLVK